MKLLVIPLLLMSGFAAAHSQGPISFGGQDDPTNSITLTGVVMVPIIVGAGQDNADFEITVDDLEPYKTIRVMSHEQMKVVVPVMMD